MAILALATSRAGSRAAARRASSSARRPGKERRRSRAGDFKARPARWRCCSRTRSVRTSCRRSRADRRSCTADRSATSRTAATASSRRESALALADIVVTEAGFGSDLGAEKFFDIKCRIGGLQSGGGGARRDGALAQDARRRRQEDISAPRTSARSSAGCRISRSTSRTCGSSASRSSSRSTGVTADTDAELQMVDGLRARGSACASR